MRRATPPHQASARRRSGRRYTVASAGIERPVAINSGGSTRRRQQRISRAPRLHCCRAASFWPRRRVIIISHGGKRLPHLYAEIYTWPLSTTRVCLLHHDFVLRHGELREMKIDNNMSFLSLNFIGNIIISSWYLSRRIDIIFRRQEPLTYMFGTKIYRAQ